MQNPFIESLPSNCPIKRVIQISQFIIEKTNRKIRRQETTVSHDIPIRQHDRSPIPERSQRISQRDQRSLQPHVIPKNRHRLRPNPVLPALIRHHDPVLLEFDHGSPALFYPYLVPSLQILSRCTFQQLDQLVPIRVRIRPPTKIPLQPDLQPPFGNLPFQHAHHDRSLVINNIPVQSSRILQIIQLLQYRVSPPRPIRPQCWLVMIQKEIQTMIYLRV